MPQQLHKGCCSPTCCQFKAICALKEYLSAQYITREEIGTSKQSLFACWHFGIFLEGMAQNHVGSSLSALALRPHRSSSFTSLRAKSATHSGLRHTLLPSCVPHSLSCSSLLPHCRPCAHRVSSSLPYFAQPTLDWLYFLRRPMRAFIWVPLIESVRSDHA